MPTKGLPASGLFQDWIILAKDEGSVQVHDEDEEKEEEDDSVGPEQY